MERYTLDCGGCQSFQKYQLCKYCIIENVLNSLIEILHKPSEEEIKNDFEKWTGILMRVAKSGGLDFDGEENSLFHKKMCEYFASIQAGRLSPYHRDRKTLDKVKQYYSQVSARILEDQKRIGTSTNLLNFVGRAANMIVTTYFNANDMDGDQRFERIAVVAKKLAEERKTIR
jgi:hypothetical protein